MYIYRAINSHPGAERRQQTGQSHNEQCMCAALLGLLTMVNEVTLSWETCWH